SAGRLSMSRRRRQASRPQTDSGASPAAPKAGIHSPASAGPSVWLTSVVAVLMLARYFLPAESAALGETLWIVQFWLMAAVVWFWLAARRGEAGRRFDAFDLAVALLVGGHVLSAGAVLLGEGDRRAALNMLWEWLGIGVTTLMIRDVL